MADPKNFSYSTVATAPSPATSGTSLVVAAGEGAKFAIGRPATIWPAGAQPSTTNAEIVMVTAIATDTLTITRAQEGTAARTVLVGDQIAQTMTAALAMRNTWEHPPATSSTGDSTAVAIPIDNTIPQSGEGKEYLTKAITPLNPSSSLLLLFTSYASASAPSSGSVAFFKDSDANAVDGGAHYMTFGGASFGLPVSAAAYIPTAGSGSRTYKLRYGPQSAAVTMYMLRAPAGSSFATAAQSILRVIEILP